MGLGQSLEPPFDPLAVPPTGQQRRLGASLGCQGLSLREQILIIARPPGGRGGPESVPGQQLSLEVPASGVLQLQQTRPFGLGETLISPRASRVSTEASPVALQEWLEEKRETCGGLRL